MKTIVVHLLLLLVSLPCFGELFRNAYLSFELPPNWKCNLEGTEWVCVSQYSQKAKEAIIILTAKEAGPNDSLSAFEQHLKTPKNLMLKNGRSTPSKVYTVKHRQINTHQWVDGLHFNSEVENYYTRYVATVKNKVAVLVTFSAHRQHYTKYSNDFFRAIQSLRVVPPKMNLAGGTADGPKGPNAGQIGTAPIAPLGPGIEAYNDSEDVGGFTDTEVNIAILALIFAAIGFYLLKKRKSR